MQKVLIIMGPEKDLRAIAKSLSLRARRTPGMHIFLTEVPDHAEPPDFDVDPDVEKHALAAAAAAEEAAAKLEAAAAAAAAAEANGSKDSSQEVTDANIAALKGDDVVNVNTKTTTGDNPDAAQQDEANAAAEAKFQAEQNSNKEAEQEAANKVSTAEKADTKRHNAKK